MATTNTPSESSVTLPRTMRGPGSTWTLILSDPYRTYRIHPAAAVFPMLPEDELTALVDDIEERDVLEKIVLWNDGEKTWVLDGRTRAAALLQLGRDITPYTIVLSREDVPDPAAYVISKNIRRRHLTKEQQAALILKAVEATMPDSANVARSVPGDASGRGQGSTRDPLLAAAVEEGKKHDIGERTMKRARSKEKAEQQGETKPARSAKPRATQPSTPLPASAETSDVRLAEVLDSH